MNGYWSDADHEAHEMQCELEGECGDAWFEGETKGAIITFALETYGECADAMHRLKQVFPFMITGLDFEASEPKVTVTGVSCEFARGIAQDVAEGIVLCNWTAKKARELLDRETIEHARRYL